VLSRRKLLQGAAALLVVRDALAQQQRVERGIYRVRGEVEVNGQPAREGAEVRAGDAIRTGANGEIVFEIGRTHV